MADNFNLPIEFNRKETAYPVQIMRYGHTHKVHVMVDNVLVVFEPDEERNYRATVDPTASPNINRALLEEISVALQFLLGD